MGLKIQFGPAYSPWSNGINERKHCSVDVIVNKIMTEDKSITLEDAVSIARWTRNTIANTAG